MPSSKKELPNARKWVTVSARARTSVKKSRRTSASELDGWYVQRVKRTADVGQKQQPAPHSDNEVICVGNIKDSNEALLKRMDKVEQQAFRDTTPINPRSHAFDHRGISLPTSLQQPTLSADSTDQIRDHLAIQYSRQKYSQPATVPGSHHSSLATQPANGPYHPHLGQLGTAIRSP